jgi:hypothetical protein
MFIHFQSTSDNNKTRKQQNLTWYTPPSSTRWKSPSSSTYQSRAGSDTTSDSATAEVVVGCSRRGRYKSVAEPII